MAKKADDSLFDRLRAQGLRKRVARDLSDALGESDGRAATMARKTAGELRKLADELEERVGGGPAKRRSVAARKAATTRKRQAAQRTAAARKAARTRAAKR
jgi:hypothetical protein